MQVPTQINPFTLPWAGAYWASDPGWSNPGNGVKVSTWRDGSPMGVAATQATSGQQPTFRATAVNGQAGVQFVSASTTGLTASPATGSANPSTIIAIGTLDLAAGGGNVYLTASGGGAAILFVGAGSTAIYGWSNNSPISPGSSGTGLIAVRYLENGASSTIKVNGASATGNPGNAGLGTPRTIGFDGSGNPSDFTAGFVGFYPGDITADVNWAAFQTWAASFYGATLT